MRKNKLTFEKNVLDYIPIIILFVIGVIGGAIFANVLSTENAEQLKNYINQFLANFKLEEIHGLELFRVSLIQHFKTIFILWVLGLFIFGMPFVYLYVGVKGFGYGFTSAFMMKQLGWTGFWFGVFGYLPQNLVFIPTFIVLSGLSIHYCKQKKQKIISKSRRGQEEHKQPFSSYVLYLVFSSIIVVLCSGIEAYITPIFLKFIIG